MGGWLPVVMKSTIFSDITPCSHAGFLLRLFFDPEDGGYMFLRNVGWQRTTRRYIREDDTLRFVHLLVGFDGLFLV
jgi:hypothetical protein